MGLGPIFRLRWLGPLPAIFVEFSLGDCPHLYRSQRQHGLLPVTVILALAPAWLGPCHLSLSVPPQCPILGLANRVQNSRAPDTKPKRAGFRALGGPPQPPVLALCPRAPSLSLVLQEAPSMTFPWCRVDRLVNISTLQGSGPGPGRGSYKPETVEPGALKSWV